ncbi:MAG TPA: hypothetical protein VFK09_08740 [Gemmatimonadales bacterium]|nr:hypothetical protein [Gemmatimonadales bacterium]
MSQPIHPSGSAAGRGSAEAKAELVSRIVGVLSRTFAADGPGAAVQALTARLLKMDEPALRQLALSMGLDEPGEPEPDEA